MENGSIGVSVKSHGHAFLLGSGFTRLFFCFVVTTVLAVRDSQAEQREVETRSPKGQTSDIRKEGSVRSDNELNLKLVWCPPGTFTMADSISKPDRIAETTKLTPVQVTLSQGYWIGKFPVTQSEWRQAMKTTPWRGRAPRIEEHLPATYITWNDAVDFCHKLTEQERRAGRLPEACEYTLPTEAQWEWACRAGTQTRYCFGDDASKLGQYAWFYDNSYKVGDNRLHPIGQKKPNRWGIHDMHGNVCEWCRDRYVEKLPGGLDPEVKATPSPDTLRVNRGGWITFSAAMCEAGYRRGESPGYRNGDFGGRAGGNLGLRVTLSRKR
jgi:formylglycine-generating enzyme required for sulfatase activity